MNSMPGMLLAVAAVLLAVILLMVAVRYWTRARASEGRRIGVVERHTLSKDAELLLVRRDGEEHLICLNENGGFLIEAHVNRKQAASEPAPHVPVAPPPPVAPATPATPAAAPASATAGGAPHVQPPPAAPRPAPPPPPAAAPPPARPAPQAAPAAAAPPARKEPPVAEGGAERADIAEAPPPPPPRQPAGSGE